MAAPCKQRFLKKLLFQSTRICSHTHKTFHHRRINTSSFDPGPIFFRSDVQSILRRITGLNLDIVFKFRPLKEYTEPSYELLTESELQKKQEETLARANDLMQMPPYLKLNDDPEDIISDDPEIDGHNTHNIVFTDITYGIPDKERSILVREPGGKLRSATYEEKNRIQQVYFPREGKTIHVPEMFEEQMLENLLAEGKYEYILDRACVQFEPDESNYIRVTHRTYEYINSVSGYDCLRSTRHFGPMSFYLAHYQKPEGLLVDMIQRNLINDAADLVDLYHIIHTDAESLNHLDAGDGHIERIQAYLKYSSKNPSLAELALQTYIDSKKEKATS